MNLDDLQIATPCPMKWNDMRGDERKRFCGRCKLHVYNLSEMAKAEATALVSAGGVCVTMRRRADGTVITNDCRGGFSTRFFEKYGTFERKGMVGLVVASLAALFFAMVTTLFSDNMRALFSYTDTGALAGDTTVERRVTKQQTGTIRSFNQDNSGY
jgi:hypothetical protein